jgi:hypothetical protein
MFAALTALAVVATVLAGCGSSATADRGAGTTPTATTAPTSTPTATAPATSTPSRFVCANPAGSMLTYAYNDPSGNLMEVTGCSTPRLLMASSPGGYPIAWSPTNRYLMVSQPRPSGGGNQDVAIDVQTLNVVPTQYYGFTPCCSSAPATVRIFIGWLDDSNFLGALVTVPTSPSDLNSGPFTIVKVDLQTQNETKVTSILWAADMKLRGSGAYLFYGGFQSKTEGGAYLHRITLTSGADTKLAPLGYAGPGACMAGPPCNWTAPWDVSPDGAHVIYHSPGPTRGPSDTYREPDTPLVYANEDGSSPSKPFGSKTASSITTPVFSPSGGYVMSAYSTYDPQASGVQTAIAAVTGGATIVNRTFAAWRGDCAALVLLGQDGDVRDTVLYALSGSAILQLQALAANYLWAN